MDPYSRAKYGKQVYTQYVRGNPDENSGPVTPDQTIVSSSTVLESFVAHTGWLQESGDFESPTPHSYAVSRDYHGYGTKLQSFPDDSYIRVTGPGLAGAFSFIEADYDVAYNRAVGKLYDSMRSGLDLSIDLSERGQVVRMVRNVLSIRKLALKVKDLPGSWLEYQYGWRPLVSSIYEAGSILQRQAERRCRQAFKARASDVISKSTKVTVEGLGYTDTFNMKSSRRCEIGARFSVTDKWYELVADYTSLNPASIAWELMPYSFVVDWVYDVGGYLRNMETSLVYKDAFQSGYVTRTQSDECFKTRAYFTPEPSFGTKQSGHAIGSAVRRFKERSGLPSSPTPRPPSIKAKLGWERLTSAAALLSKAFRR